MGSLTHIANSIVSEQAILKATKNKELSRAITKRHPVSFVYTGKRKDIKSGKRVRVELVALGLSKKGNVIVRGYVTPPSVTKTGYDKGHWKTFMVSRMYSIQVHTEDVFNTQRDDYKAGDDGSMSATYVTTDWGKTAEPTTDTPTQVPSDNKPVQKQTKKPTDAPSELPQPDAAEKPSVEPNGEPAQADAEPEQTEDNLTAKAEELILKAKDENGVKSVSNDDFQNTLQAIGGAEKESELRAMLDRSNVAVSDAQTPLAEAIRRIKTLISH